MLEHIDLQCGFEIKSDTGDPTFSGVASTDDLDQHNDIVEAGAFDPIDAKAVRLLRDHDRSQVIGGCSSFEQKGSKLHLEGVLCLEDNPKARETYALMKRGFLSGISVGFSIPDRKKGVVYQDDGGRRVIKKGLLQECSIVAFPANKKAKVTNVKSMSTGELRNLLVEAGFGLYDVDVLMAKGGAALLAAKQQPLLFMDDDADETMPDGTRAGGDGSSEAKQGTIPSGMRKPKEDESRDDWMSYCIGELSDEGFTGDERMAICLRAFRDGERPRTTKERNLKPWGDVEYADPGYQEDKVKRYPIHRESNIRAAWSYINMDRNQEPYTAEQVAAIKRRIIAAWKRKIDPDGPPSAQKDKKEDLQHEILSLTRALQEIRYG